MSTKRKRKNPAAVALAARRHKSLSPERRSEIAKLANAARLAKAGTDPEKLRALTEKAAASRRKSNAE
jgi:hypothetical protein